MIKDKNILVFCCFFLLIFKAFSIYYTKFDLFGDEAQYWIWSKNLDFGYFSKPPLLPWVIYVYCLVFGNSVFAIKMISVSFYCLSSFVVYLISNQLTINKKISLYAAITFFLMPGVSVSSFLLSTDVLLILFWSLSLLQLLKIRKRPDFWGFILLGTFLGLAFLAKYAAIYFFICTIFLLIFDKKMRDVFFSNKLSFFFCLFSFVLIIFPNVVWNTNNNWVTLHHTADNASLGRTAINFKGGLEFFISQIIMLGPLIFFYFIIGFKKIKIGASSIFLLSFSMPIFFIVLIEAFLVRANANWAAVSLVSFLIFIVHHVYGINKKFIVWNNYISFSLGVFLFYLIATSANISAFSRINGISNFAKNLEGLVSEKYEYIVVSDRMLFSNIKYIYRDKKIKLLTPISPNSKIGHHFQISNPLPKDHKKDFLYVGFVDQIGYLSNKAVINIVGNNEVLFTNDPIKIYEVIF